jgi:hypothetical protein
MHADDIVTRLRVTASEGCSVVDWTKLSWDIQEAADEIERLRKIIVELKGQEMCDPNDPCEMCKW